MIEPNDSSWFLILYSISILGIAVFVIRLYANKFSNLKNQIHEIHALIELIDESLTDDKVTKEEFVALVKRVLAVLSGIK